MGSARVSMAPLAREDDGEDTLRQAVEQALEPLGGIRGFVNQGDKVALKPNQSLFLPYTSGSTTSPVLMRVLGKLCFEAGAREVWAAEAVGHAQRSRSVMRNTGMVAGVKESGVKPMYLDELAHDVYDFGEDAGDLRYMPAPTLMDAADVIINVPKAKTHFVDPISGACKNWVGVIPMSFRLPLQRRVEAYYRATALMLRKFRPALTVFDGSWAGEGQGPGANDAFWWGWVLASTDPVAADVTLAHLFHLDKPVRMADAAARFGVGENLWESIEVLGGPLDQARHKVTPADPSVHRYPCDVIHAQIGRPGATLEGTLGHWRTIADGWLKNGVWKLFTLKGRPTFMFGDVEDPDFEKHVKQGPYVVLDDAARDKYKYDSRVTFVPGAPVPQSYMQNEMVEGMGFAGVYQPGLAAEKMIQQLKGKRAST